jgi:hypothetical protein
MRGLAGVLGAAGVAVLAGQEESSSRRRRRRRRRNQCRRDSQCPDPLNPCQKARCKKNRCRTKKLADGTICGDGLVCQDGACLCPDGVCTVKVTPSNRNGWLGLEDCGCGSGTVNNSRLTYQDGPGSPPYGAGSVEMTAEDDFDPVALGTYQFANLPLSQITAIEYTTYQPSTNVGTDVLVGILQFGIDFFGSNDPLQGRLFFIPTENGETPLQDTWQTWDAIKGGAAQWFWFGLLSTGYWPDSETPDTDPLTWAQIVSRYPDARINLNDPVLAIEIIGNDDDPFTEAINAVTIGTTYGTTRYVFGPA